jgi:hypothetical protein
MWQCFLRVFPLILLTVKFFNEYKTTVPTLKELVKEGGKKVII